MKTLSNILIILAVALVIVSCGSSDKNAELAKLKKQHDQIAEQIKKLEAELQTGDPESKPVKTTAVLVTEVTVGQFNHYIEVQGKVDGEQNVAVSPQLPAVVTQVYVNEGARVTRGQIMAQLDDNVMKQQMAALNQSVDLATTMFEKQKALWDQKIGTEVQFLQARNQKESLEKSLATMKEQLEMYKIKSPIDGSVEEVNIKIGQMAANGVLPAFRVVNFNSVKVVADIAEAYAPKVKSGNQAVVYFPDYQVEIPTTVRFSSKFINPTNRTFLAEVRLGPGKVDYRANMMAQLRINDYHNPRAIVMPVNVIKEANGESFLYLAEEKDGKTLARKQVVKIGQTYNGLAEVLGGLKEGDKVITAGQNDLSDGQLITISKPVTE